MAEMRPEQQEKDERAARLQATERAVERLVVRSSLAAEEYADARRRIEALMRDRGMTPAETDGIFEAFERNFQPKFGSASIGGGASADERRAFDQAMFGDISPELFDTLTARLRDFRAASSTASHMQENLYSIGGSAVVERANEEAGLVRDVRRQLMEEARRMAPALTIESRDMLFGSDEEAAAGNLNPVRRLMSVSLDVEQGFRETRRETLKAMWPALDEFLSDEERRVLLAGVTQPRKGQAGLELNAATADVVRERILDAFLDHAVPNDRVKPDPALKQAFKGVSGFLEKTANLARGRGFINRETIYRRALEGRIGGRATDQQGLRVYGGSDQGSLTDNRDAVRAGIGKMTDRQLRAAIDDQDQVIRAQREKRAGAFHNMLLRSPIVRGMRAAAGYFSSETRDPLMAENREMAALVKARALLLSEQRKRARLKDQAAGLKGPEAPTPSIGPGGPDGGIAADGPAPYNRLDNTMEALQGAAAANDNPGVDPEVIEGQKATYTFTGHDAADGRYYTVNAAPVGQDGRPFDVGAFADQKTAALYVSELDHCAQQGEPSAAARELAAKASGKGSPESNDDIDVIRQSGQLDKRLDDAIERKDAMAFVYPLKTGDLIWEESPGQWRAGTFEQMAEFARGREDHSLKNAVEAIREGVQERREDKRTWLDVPPSDETRAIAAGALYDTLDERWYAPNAQVVSATKEWEPGRETSQMRQERAEIRTHGDDGNIHTKQGDQIRGRVDAVITKDVDAMSDEALEARAATLYTRLSARSPSNAADARQRMADRAANAEVVAELKQRGLPVPGADKQQAARKRATGQSR